MSRTLMGTTDGHLGTQPSPEAEVLTSLLAPPEPHNASGSSGVSVVAPRLFIDGKAVGGAGFGGGGGAEGSGGAY
jgi:hypothetical protein